MLDKMHFLTRRSNQFGKRDMYSMTKSQVTRTSTSRYIFTDVLRYIKILSLNTDSNWSYSCLIV